MESHFDLPTTATDICFDSYAYECKPTTDDPEWNGAKRVGNNRKHPNKSVRVKKRQQQKKSRRKNRK